MKLLRRIRALFRKEKFDAEMAEEIRLHLELQTEKNFAAGMTPDEARYAAQRMFGGVEQIKERCRDQRGWVWLEQLGRDVVFVARLLRRSAGFTFVAVLTLALGIAVTTTTFSYFSATILRPLPFAEPEGLVQLLGTQAPADLLDIQAQSGAFAKFAIIDFPSYSLTQTGQPAERVNAVTVGGDFFSMMGVPPLLGRLFGPDEDHLGRNQVVVLSYHFWMQRFSGDAAVVGRSLQLDGEAVQVIGVLPERFDVAMLWGAADVWRPLAMVPDIRDVRVNTWLRMVARLKPEVSFAQGQASLDAIATRQQREFPLTNGKRRFFLAPLGSVDATGQRMVYLMIGASAAAILLIACANLANLQLVRSLGRSREYAVRAALGASRRRLLAQMLTESLMLSLAGGALGVVLTWAVCPMLSVRIAEVTGDATFRMTIDLRVLLFALICSVATGAAFGVVPAWLASKIDLNASLKQAGGRATGDKSRHRLRQILVVTELALTLVLLAGAGYFLHGFHKLAQRQLGWRPDHLLTGRIVLPYNRYGDFDKCWAFYNRVHEELAREPGVVASAICDSLPIFGFYNAYAVMPAEAAMSADGSEVSAYFNPVTLDYFSAMGMELQQGRNFNTADSRNSPRVAIVNRALAERFWPHENPIGKRLTTPLSAKQGWQVEIVGVVGDVAFSVNPYPRTRLQMYFPISQTGGNYLYVAVRTSVAPESMAEKLRRAVSRIDPDLAVSRVGSATQIAAESGASDALMTNGLIFVAAAGLLLSVLGLYGVVANLVAERTAEIGIRIALGAQSRDVIQLVLGQGIRLATFGVAIGSTGAWMLARFLGSYMPGILGQDPIVVAGCAGVLFAATLLACWFPTRHATKVDPMIALRTE